MRLPLNLRFEQIELRSRDALDRLVDNLQDLISRSNEQVNRLTEGKLAAVHNAQTAAPTTGVYAQGDFIRNSQPSELGAVSSRYVIIGWVCTVGGNPGTWVESRVLTGS